jgi:hypothetical protein
MGSPRIPLTIAALLLVGCASTGSIAPDSSPSPAAKATPTPSPLAIGDPCVVGRWTSTNSEFAGKGAGGAVLQYTGGAGVVVNFNADGSETGDYSNSAALVGVGPGHSTSYQVRGSERFTYHMDLGKWTRTGPLPTVSVVNRMVDGVAQADAAGVPIPLGSGTYTCTSTQLVEMQTTPSVGVATFTR